MKLRLQSNSIRLRLKRGEVDQLAKIGRIEEKIVFGPHHGTAFCYRLEVSETTSVSSATLKPGEILVQVPAKVVARWASGDEIGIEAVQSLGDHDHLQILIEKDFACLNGPEEQNIDTFPNPLAGTKC